MNNYRFITALLYLGSVAIFGVFVHTASGEPTVSISPTCGPVPPGFNIAMNANGFKASSTVSWKFVGSDGKILSYGYFDTNRTGGFNDETFTHVPKPGHYQLYFGDDSDADGIFDIGAKKVYQNVTIPCSPEPTRQTHNKS